MAININAKTTGVGGLETSADNSGNINIQSGGTTVMAVTSSGVAVTGSFSQNGAVYSTQPTFRNLIINGDMRIAQRGTSVSGITGNDYYTLDRFRFIVTTAGSWTMSQDTDVPVGQGFGNSLKVQCTTADASLASADLIELHQAFEGQNLQHLKKGTSDAEQLTLSFWVKSNKTGNFNANLIDNDNTRFTGKQLTINAANTWEKKTVTFPADTTGTLDNDQNASFRLFLTIAAGSSYNTGNINQDWTTDTATHRGAGVFNLADSTSNYINITGVQLEVGSTATEFEHLPYDVQLTRCQRYFQKTNPDDVAHPTCLSGLVFANSSTAAALYANLPVYMRIAPSITRGGTYDTFWSPGYSGTTTANFNPTYTRSSVDGLFIELSSIVGVANSAPIGYNGQLSLNAEL